MVVEHPGSLAFSDRTPDRDKPMPSQRIAILYRMILPEHTCPYGVRAKALLEQAGFDIDEHILCSREEVDAFQAEHGVATTPQIFIAGERIGGSTDLENYLVGNSG
jgi:glutaredoxin 3